MKFRLLALFLLGFVFTAAPALAQRVPVPIVNYENNPVATSSGSVITADKVKQAIMTAAAKKQWRIAHAADGTMLGTLVVNGKHTIVVKIAYTATQYSITYQDSINMKYRISEEGPVIHPYYDKWVNEFRGAIRNELMRY